MPENKKSLGRLRQEIAELDSHIVELFSKRLDCAERIGMVKKQLEFPIRDHQIEKQVHGRYKALCDNQGIDIEAARDLADMVIREALKIQEKWQIRNMEVGITNILLIGGAGAMGRWFNEFFRQQGHRCRVVDPALGLPLEGLTQGDLEGVEFVLSCVPLACAGDVHRSLLSHMRAGQVLVDIYSLKAPILACLPEAKRKNIEMVSLHPLFGPGQKLLSGSTMLLADCGFQRANRQVMTWFEETALSCPRLAIEDHDPLMGILLGAGHAINYIFMMVMERSGYSWSQLRNLATTTFSKQGGTAQSVLMEDDRLYYDIQHLNPASPKLHQWFSEACQRFAAASQNSTNDDFSEIAARIREYMQADNRQ